MRPVEPLTKNISKLENESRADCNLAQCAQRNPQVRFRRSQQASQPQNRDACHQQNYHSDH
jgi:hypothetical protein